MLICLPPIQMECLSADAVLTKNCTVAFQCIQLDSFQSVIYKNKIQAIIFSDKVQQYNINKRLDRVENGLSPK